MPAALDLGLDVELRGVSLDDRGFYSKDETVQFFRDVHEAAKRTNTNWRALYNHFEVAKAINEELGKKFVDWQKYHGPKGAVLHVHLYVWPKSSPSTGSSTGGASP